MGNGQKILDGLRDAVVGNMTRISFFVDGKRETWTRHDVDSPEAHLALARDLIADLQTEVDMLKAHIGQSERN
jgi:hypothetical protein